MTSANEPFAAWLASCKVGLDGDIVTRANHSEHHYPLVIQYEDTDAGSITYHASYINFAERARSAWLRASGFSLGHWLSEYQQGFVIRKLEAEYKTPSKLHDQMVVRTLVARCGRASVELHQNIFHENGLISARVIVHGCWVEINSGPKAFPAPLRDIISTLQHGQ